MTVDRDIFGIGLNINNDFGISIDRSNIANTQAYRSDTNYFLYL